MIVAQLTDVGRKRSHNEDSLGMSRLEIRRGSRAADFVLALVCDGMGGAAAGEIASGMAVESLCVGVYRRLADRVGDPGVAFLGIHQILRDAIQEANREVHEAARSRPGHSGMGCTATVALVGRRRLWFAQVGDSRGYLWRGRELRQITRDHSFVNELLQEGRLTPEEAEAHPRKSVITRAIGSRPDVEPDVFEVVLEEGDVYLVCSDGLTGMVSDDELAGILAELPRPVAQAGLDAAAAAMIARANEAGGADNVSVVLLAAEPRDLEGRLEDPPQLAGGKVLSWQEAVEGRFPDASCELVRRGRRR